MDGISTATNRAVAYVRVSTMHEDAVSPELQLTAIRDWCHRNGYELTRVIEDLDMSGRFWRNRHIDDAIQMIEAGEVDVLVVWRWSRVSRDRYDWALAVSRVETTGGLLISATEDFDTSTSVGRFVRGVLAEFAAFESDRLGDLWLEVYMRRIRLGLTPTGKDQFGYRKQPDGRYVPDQRTAALLVAAYERYVDGQSFEQIAAWLRRHKIRVTRTGREPSLIQGHTVTKWLDHGFGAGLVTFDGESYPGSHPAVVSAELWTAYQAARNARRVPVERTRMPLPDLYGGLLRCGHCGELMTLSAVHRTRLRYACKRHASTTRAPTVLVLARIDGLVYRWLAALAHDTPRAAAVRRDARKHTTAAGQRASALARAISNDPDNEELRTQHRAADKSAAWRDPVAVAAVLVEQWSALPVDLKADQLRHLITSLTVRRTRDPNKITLVVATTWGTRSTYTIASGKAHLFPDEDNERWVQPQEAGTILGVSPRTLSVWYRSGALPLTRERMGCRYYATTDIHRMLRHQGHTARARFDIAGALAELTTAQRRPAIQDVHSKQAGPVATGGSRRGVSVARPATDLAASRPR